MFERASEIRAAQRAKIRERGRQEGRKEALAEVRHRLDGSVISKDPETGAITLTITPEDMDFLLGDSADSNA